MTRSGRLRMAGAKDFSPLQKGSAIPGLGCAFIVREIDWALPARSFGSRASPRTGEERPATNGEERLATNGRGKACHQRERKGLPRTGRKGLPERGGSHNVGATGGRDSRVRWNDGLGAGVAGGWPRTGEEGPARTGRVPQRRGDRGTRFPRSLE